MQNRNEWARDIIELYDNGYYISGGFEGDEFIKGWKIKTDINLEFIYDKVMEHDLGTVASRASISDDNGNIYVTGYTTYPDQWPFVTKLNSCGDKLWCKILIYEEEFTNGWSNDIILSGNDEVVILATLTDNLQPADQINMTHLIGLSDEGEVLWKKPYASRNDYSWIRQPQGHSIKKIKDDYYISGFCYWPYPDDTTHFFLRPLFIGIDSLFEEKWILPFYALDSVLGIAYKSISVNDSLFMGVGIRKLPNSLDFGLLMFYNNDGEEIGFNELSNQQIGPDVNSNQFRDIARINDTLFMTSSLFGPGISTNPGGVLVIDTAANLYNQLPKPNTSSADLIKSYDGNYIFVTSIEESKGDNDIYVYKINENLNDVPFDPTPHTYDSLCPGGIQSGTVDLTNCFIWTDISETPSPGEYYSFIKTIPVKAFPNPATAGQVTFEFENTEYLPPSVPAWSPTCRSGKADRPPKGGKWPSLRIFNIFGEKVHEERIYRGQGESRLNVGAWPQGMYIAVVVSEGRVVGRVKFVVR
ncbi:MAG: hypothetical protein JXA03_07970 [Bacteroidales bacterium]|nr:hypothetical protein [Bacteroidales bacterium]